MIIYTNSCSVQNSRVETILMKIKKHFQNAENFTFSYREILPPLERGFHQCASIVWPFRDVRLSADSKPLGELHFYKRPSRRSERFDDFLPQIRVCDRASTACASTRSGCRGAGRRGRWQSLRRVRWKSSRAGWTRCLPLCRQCLEGRMQFWAIFLLKEKQKKLLHNSNEQTYFLLEIV